MAVDMLPPVVTRLTMTLDDFRNGVAEAKGLLKTLDTNVVVNVDVNDDLAKGKLAAIAATVIALNDSNPTIRVNTDGITSAVTAVETLKDSIESLARYEDALEAVTVTTTMALGRQRDAMVEKGAATSSLSRRLATLIGREATLSAAARASGSALGGAAAVAAARAAAPAPGGGSGSRSGGTVMGYRPYGIWGAVAAAGAVRVPLFGDALNTANTALRGADSTIPSVVGHLVGFASGWHLAAEAVIEFTAVWVPAAVAMGAFGAAAYPTAKAVYTQITDMNTAADATGRSFDSLAMKGQSLTAAVKPSVLEAFGVGLYTIQRDSGTLAPILSGLGKSIDQIVARASVALSGGGSSFLKTGAQDASQLMTAFGDLFGIFGNLMKAVPGYAAVLLQFGTDVLGWGESVSGSVERVLAVFLKLHGAIFYGGLFGTAASFAFSKVVSLADGATNALKGLLVSVSLVSEDSAAFGAISAALETIGSGPVLAGIGLAAGAIAAVVMYLRAGGNAASGFGADLQNAVKGAQVSTLQGTLLQNIAAAQQKVTSTTQGLTKAQAEYNSVSYMDTHSVPQMLALGGYINSAKGDLSGYTSVLQQQQKEYQNYTANVTAVAHALGVSVPQALAVLSGAQVSNNQLTATGANNLDQLIVMAQGYEAQLKVMTTGTGNLNQALNAIKVTTSSQYTDIQNLTSAYSTWIGVVTGGDSAFTTFEQGQSTLIADLKSGGETVNTTLGKISDKFTTVKSSLNGTSSSALAARQAFDSQTNAAVSLYNALATQAAMSGNSTVAQTALAQAGKDVVAQMLPLASGSAEATSEVFALAQIVGYTGNNSFSGLAKWVGNTKNAESDLNKQQQILTQTTADLTQAAKNLASGLQGQVTQAMVNAIANTSNLNGTTQNLANAFSKSHGQITSQVQDMAKKYISALQSMGIPNSQIAGALAALAGSYGVNAKAAQQWANQAVQAANRVKAALAQIQSKTITLTVLTNAGSTGLTNLPKTSSAPIGVASQAALRAAHVPGYASGTSGAARGWAWVGEAGPELVKFHGGENVIPSHVAKGYANGTGGDAVHEVNVYLDGRQIYKSVRQSAVNTQRRTGSNGLSKRVR